MQTTVTWKDVMAFDTELDGYHFGIDAHEKFGGRGMGPKPKGLMLSALAGCTAMDVISILTKMRVAPTSFKVTVDGELAAEHPKVFTDIVVKYLFEGEDLPEKKLRRAVELSETRYCGVSAMLKPVANLSHEIWVNGTQLAAE